MDLPALQSCLSTEGLLTGFAIGRSILIEYFEELSGGRRNRLAALNTIAKDITKQLLLWQINHFGPRPTPRSAMGAGMAATCLLARAHFKAMTIAFHVSRIEVRTEFRTVLS